jgi:hypothetical protein
VVGDITKKLVGSIFLIMADLTRAVVIEISISEFPLDEKLNPSIAKILLPGDNSSTFVIISSARSEKKRIFSVSLCV